MTGDDEIRDPQTYAILGACMAVHNELGCGFTESIYQDALAVELRSCNIPFERECKIEIRYKGELLESFYKADFVCFQSVILECKAIAELAPIHETQVFNYLKATGIGRGLLVNFGTSRLSYKRIVRGHPTDPRILSS